MKPAVLHWSSGKDSAFALRRLREQGEMEVKALLCTVSEEYGRVAIHGVRRELLHAQAHALDLPLLEVPLPNPCSNEEYEGRMKAALERLGAAGITDHVFGDFMLEDIRNYREGLLARLGLEAHFPLWGASSPALARDIVLGGIRAHVVVVDPQRLPRELSGQAFDKSFLAALPEEVDPCGERGEFHTLVSACPDFSAPLSLRRGETLERDGLLYTDFLLQESVAS